VPVEPHPSAIREAAFAGPQREPGVLNVRRAYVDQGAITQTCTAPLSAGYVVAKAVSRFHNHTGPKLPDQRSESTAFEALNVKLGELSGTASDKAGPFRCAVRVHKSTHIVEILAAPQKS